MRFGFPKDERAALEVDEMRELVLDAWSMCVPKTVSRDYFSAQTSTTDGPPPPA